MTPFVDLELPPGRVLEWAIRPSSKLDPSIRAIEATKRPSFTQELYYHQIDWLSRLHEGRLSVWIGVTFEIEGKADLEALRAAFRQLLIRHETLRAEFRMEPDRDGTGMLFGRLQCDILAPSALQLDETELGTYDDVDEMHQAIIRRVDGGLNTVEGPVLLMGAVIGEEKSVAYIICDHLVTDGFSCAIKANELATLYESALAGSGAKLAPVGSYLDFGAREYDDGWTVTPDDPRVEMWRGFVKRNGHVFTEFPADLHAKRGEWHPAMVDQIQVLTPAEAEAFEKLCKERGASLVAGILACNGIALHELSGIDVYRTVMPVATRREAPWQYAVGWLVGIAPLEVPVAGPDKFNEVLAGAYAAFRAGLTTSDLPIASLFTHLGTQYLPLRGLFDLLPQGHFSYIDYRKLPGAINADRWKQSTALRATNTSDARTWFYRTPEGIFMFTNFIDTPRAREVHAQYQVEMRRALATALVSLENSDAEDDLENVA
ncbi:MAG TPA: condensation domain-containing protein [Polyangiaceae bacterium]|nr:condensation domain-containing protein [Polyangiaceae bacterium]